MQIKFRTEVITGLFCLFLLYQDASAQMVATLDSIHAAASKTAGLAFLTDSSKTDSVLVQLLKQYPQYFDSVLQNKKNGMFSLSTPKLTRVPMEFLH